MCRRPPGSTLTDTLCPSTTLCRLNPVIAPSSLLIYSGAMFPDWQGDAFIGGLASQALVRVEFDGDSAREAQRFDMGARIRAVEQSPDGAIWLLEDGEGGRLLKPTPKP